MPLLTGMTEDGSEVPVQVAADGRLVAEGLQGIAGPQGIVGPAGPAGPQGPQGPKGDVSLDPQGRLLVGTSSVRSNIYKDAFTNIPTAQFETATNTYNNGLSLLNYSANGYGPVLSLGTSFSNTPGTNALLVSGGDMGWINFTGNDGTNFRTGASIGALVDGTSGSGDMPGRLVFSTTADGASSPREAMKIDARQRVCIKSPNGAWWALQVSDSGALSAVSA
jgi:hypothetical protein